MAIVGCCATVAVGIARDAVEYEEEVVVEWRQLPLQYEGEEEDLAAAAAAAATEEDRATEGMVCLDEKAPSEDDEDDGDDELSSSASVSSSCTWSGSGVGSGARAQQGPEQG